MDATYLDELEAKYRNYLNDKYIAYMSLATPYELNILASFVDAATLRKFSNSRYTEADYTLYSTLIIEEAVTEVLKRLQEEKGK